MKNLIFVAVASAFILPMLAAEPLHVNLTGAAGADDCGQFEADVFFLVDYVDKDNKSMVANVTLPVNGSTVSTTCEQNSTSLTVVFFGNWQLSFTFSNDTAVTDKNQWILYQADAQYASVSDPTDFPNITMQVKGKMDQTYDKSTSPITSQVGYSYACQHGAVDLDGGKQSGMKLELRHLNVQPFSTKSDFDILSTCTADQKTSNLVPIIVGACLAVLVIVVLVAYIVGRIRAKRQGYSSV